MTSAGARGYQIANCYGSGAGGGSSTVLMSGSNQNELGRPTDSVSPQVEKKGCYSSFLGRFVAMSQVT